MPYATLPAVIGMRLSKPLCPDRDDVATGVLTVRKGKSRRIPVHASTQQTLARCAAQRDRLCPHARDPGFFLAESGTRITEWALRWTLVALARQVGLRGPPDSRRLRLQDLRHRFAVAMLLRWYRHGTDVGRHLPRLATYLGHSHARHALVSGRHPGTAGGGRPVAR